MVFHAYQFGCGIVKQKTDSRYVLEPVLTFFVGKPYCFETTALSFSQSSSSFSNISFVRAL